VEPAAAAGIVTKEALKVKKIKEDRRLYEEQISDEEESVLEKTPVKKTKDDHLEEEFFVFEKPTRPSRPLK